MGTSPQPLFKSAAYVNGQLMALQAAFVALARFAPDREALRAEIQRQLEQLRTALLPSGMPDDALAGIDRIEEDLMRLV